MPAIASDDPVQAAELLAELETSLLASQKFLLAWDVAGLERCTATQNQLVEKFCLLCARGDSFSNKNQTAEELAPASSPLNAAHAGPSLVVQGRVLHQVRVQAALLRRGQRHLIALAHLKAGIGATYGPPDIRQTTDAAIAAGR